MIRSRFRCGTESCCASGVDVLVLYSVIGIVASGILLFVSRFDQHFVMESNAPHLHLCPVLLRGVVHVSMGVKVDEEVLAL